MTGFFQETPGVYSAMRLMCFLALLAAMVFGALTVLGKGSTDGVTITLAFLSYSVGGKVVQKFAESTPTSQHGGA